MGDGRGRRRFATRSGSASLQSATAGGHTGVRRASDLIGSRVETATGDRLGRVVDLVVGAKAPWAVTHLLVGPSTFVGRFSVLRHAARPLGGFGAHDAIPWSAVERLDGRRIVVRPPDVGVQGDGEKDRGHGQDVAR